MFCGRFSGHGVVIVVPCRETPILPGSLVSTQCRHVVDRQTATRRTIPNSTCTEHCHRMGKREQNLMKLKEAYCNSIIGSWARLSPCSAIQ